MICWQFINIILFHIWYSFLHIIKIWIICIKSIFNYPCLKMFILKYTLLVQGNWCFLFSQYERHLFFTALLGSFSKLHILWVFETSELINRILNISTRTEIVLICVGDATLKRRVRDPLHIRFIVFFWRVAKCICGALLKIDWPCILA